MAEDTEEQYWSQPLGEDWSQDGPTVARLLFMCDSDHKKRWLGDCHAFQVDGRWGTIATNGRAVETGTDAPLSRSKIDRRTGEVTQQQHPGPRFIQSAGRRLFVVTCPCRKYLSWTSDQLETELTGAAGLGKYRVVNLAEGYTRGLRATVVDCFLGSPAWTVTFAGLAIDACPAKDPPADDRIPSTHTHQQCGAIRRLLNEDDPKVYRSWQADRLSLRVQAHPRGPRRG